MPCQMLMLRAESLGLYFTRGGRGCDSSYALKVRLHEHRVVSECRRTTVWLQGGRSYLSPTSWPDTLHLSAQRSAVAFGAAYLEGEIQ